jgi:hemolysin type calcium-binding protein
MASIRLAVAVVLAAAAVPDTASAATVSYRPPVCYRECGPAMITFRAAAGEHNRLAITPVDDQAASATTATVELYGDDGDDVLGGNCRGRGGAGNDRIDQCADAWGDDGDDLLIAAAKDSRLTGGPGADDLQGGAGHDVLHDASPEPNRFDGGPGTDVVSFRGRTAPVVVDLAEQRPPLTAVEGVEGGDGPDILRGSEGPDLIHGDRGEDVLAGRGGADRIAGGPGYDRFDAGGGDDVVYADSYDPAGLTYGLDLRLPGPTYWDAEPEPVVCGPGRDRVERLGGDLLAPDCELLNERFTAPPRRVRRGWSWSIPCLKWWRTRDRCRGTMTLDSGYYGHGGFVDLPQRRRLAIRGARGRAVFPYLPDGVFEVRMRLRSRRGPVLIRWRLDAGCFERRYRESRCGSRPGT